VVLTRGSRWYLSVRTLLGACTAKELFVEVDWFAMTYIRRRAQSSVQSAPSMAVRLMEKSPSRISHQGQATPIRTSPPTSTYLSLNGRRKLQSRNNNCEALLGGCCAILVARRVLNTATDICVATVQFCRVLQQALYIIHISQHTSVQNNNLTEHLLRVSLNGRQRFRYPIES
jgi:hypothetical protein